MSEWNMVGVHSCNPILSLFKKVSLHIDLVTTHKVQSYQCFQLEIFLKKISFQAILENPTISSLSSGYFSTNSESGINTSSHFKLKSEEITVVPANNLEDDEPNILTNKTCLPNKVQGFSHLEWSASIPYNMAEEPDDVQGKEKKIPWNQLFS